MTLEAVKTKIVAVGDKAEIAPLDIINADDCYSTVERIVNTHEPLNMVIDSAGLNRPQRRWKDIDQESFHIVVDVDLKGTFNVCQAAIQVMRQQRDGLIIDISSMASQGRFGGVSGFPYAAAKHGMNVMNESINDEHAHMSIRACALCPSEVTIDILGKRPNPPSPDERARMVQELRTRSALSPDPKTGPEAVTSLRPGRSPLAQQP